MQDFLLPALTKHTPLWTLEIGFHGREMVSQSPRLSLQACLVVGLAGDVGAKALGRCLCSNRRLKTLYLSGNQIGNAGAEALSESLKKNTSLTVLHLTGNAIGTQGAEALANALRVNRTLTKVRKRGGG